MPSWRWSSGTWGARSAEAVVVAVAVAAVIAVVQVAVAAVIEV